MSSAWTVSLPAGAVFGKQLTRRIRDAHERGARAILAAQVDKLRRGLAPDGSAQKQNAPSTLAAKARKGQGSTPLVATGLLSRISAYRVERTGNALVSNVRIRMPSGREKTLEFLRAKGYRLLEVSDADLKLLQAAYLKALASMPSPAKRGGSR